MTYASCLTGVCSGSTWPQRGFEVVVNGSPPCSADVLFLASTACGPWVLNPDPAMQDTGLGQALAAAALRQV